MNLLRVGAMAWAAVRNLVLGANLASLQLLANPRRLIYFTCENLLLLRSLAGKRRLCSKNVYEVFGVREPVSVRLGSFETGEAWFWWCASHTADIISLTMLCRILHPRVIFEIGTLKGYTAYHLALNSDEDAKVYTLDLPPAEDASPKLSVTSSDVRQIRRHAAAKRMCWEGTNVADRIVPLCGDSAVFDFSPYHGLVDLFFVDGAHSYDYVKSDTLNAQKCCHRGSVIAWHDYGRVGLNGVTRWLHELARDRNIYSIPGGSLAFHVIE